MKDPIQPTRCAKLLSALAAPERLRIIRYLRDGPRNVSEVADTLKTALVNVSHHLNVLRHAGIVRSRKQGRYVFYALSPGFLQMTNDARDIEYLDLGCCRLELPRGTPAPDQGPGEPGA